MAGLLGVPHVSYLQSAALAVSSVSVLTKELLYHYTLRVGQGAHSDAVKVTLQWPSDPPPPPPPPVSYPF